MERLRAASFKLQAGALFAVRCLYAQLRMDILFVEQVKVLTTVTIQNLPGSKSIFDIFTFAHSNICTRLRYAAPDRHLHIITLAY
jgi:hypothetical protein